MSSQNGMYRCRSQKSLSCRCRTQNDLECIGEVRTYVSVSKSERFEVLKSEWFVEGAVSRVPEVYLDVEGCKACQSVRSQD